MLCNRINYQRVLFENISQSRPPEVKPFNQSLGNLLEKSKRVQYMIEYKDISKRRKTTVKIIF